MTPEVLELLMHRDTVMVEDALRKYYVDEPGVRRLLEAEQYSLFAGGKNGSYNAGTACANKETNKRM